MAQGNNLENGKNKFDSLFLLLPYIFLKNIAFPIYIFRNYHFDSKIIVSLSIAFHSIQHFSSMINDFHLLKFQISSINTQCFKTNILTLITLIYIKKIAMFFNVRPVKFSWIKPFSLKKGNLTAIKRQSRHWIKLWCMRSFLLQYQSYERYWLDIVLKISLQK